MRRKFCIIHNPRTGWHSRHLFSATLEKLRSTSATYEIFPTERRGQGTGLASAAARSGAFDAIIAAGGDGTIHDVAAGLVGGSLPLGVIPLGTGNVFAHELGYTFNSSALSRALLRGLVIQYPLAMRMVSPFSLLLASVLTPRPYAISKHMT